MKYFLSLLLSVVAVFSFSQERLTLQDAISRALQYNYDIRIAANNLEQATQNNIPGSAGLYPTIGVGGGLSYGVTDTRIDFADGRIQERRGASTLTYNGGLTGNYTFFAAGRAWLVRKQLGENEELARIRWQEQIQAMVSQVIQTYSRVVWQQQQRVAIDSGLALANVRMMLSRVKFETGASAKVDFLQARVDYNARQSDSLQQEASVTAAFADLNVLMGTDPYQTYVVDDSLELNLSLTPSDKERLKQINLSIEAERRNAAIAGLDLRVARTFLYPTLSTNFGYNYNRTQSQAGFALFNRTIGPTAGLNLNIPIFEGGIRKRDVRIASLNMLRQDLVLERQQTDIGRQYRTAWRNYETSVAAYKLEQENIGYARENLDIQRARFRVGIATTLETREAENSYVTALIRLYTAAYNVKLQETRVLELESALVK